MKIAIIFAAGAGQRLNPLTKTINKSLIKINDVPLIEYLIKNLLAIKNLQEITIITGYRAKDFDYLKNKYQNLTIIFNKNYLKYESAYVLSLLAPSVFDHDLFFVTGDFVMKENCFASDIKGNVMAAMKRISNKNDWSYQLDQQGNIIGLAKNSDINSLLASEWSHIDHKWAKEIFNVIQDEAELKTLQTTIIGKYLINRSIKDKINLKPFLLTYNSFWDLDDYHDLERINKYFNL